MRGSSFVYLLKEGVRNMWVNRMMSLASVGVLVCCMLLIGAAVLFSLNLNGIVTYFENQNEMAIFLEDDATDAQVENVQKRLDAHANILSYSFVSRDDALEQFADIVPDSLLESLREDQEEVFPLSFRVTIEDLSLLAQTVQEIEKIDGVAQVNAPTEVAETVTGLKQAVYLCGTVIVLILLVVSLIIIANTIKVTVFNRRKEINIMKFVGATDLFIRMPFVIEGMLLGLLSAGLAYGILWGGYEYLLKHLSENGSLLFASFSKNLVQFSEVAYPLLASFAVGGIGVGVFGSMIFVRKHLKV